MLNESTDFEEGLPIKMASVCNLMHLNAVNGLIQLAVLLCFNLISF